ncbi:MAG: histidinol phosphatase [Isosphaeraceae bacterium]
MFTGSRPLFFRHMVSLSVLFIGLTARAPADDAIRTRTSVERLAPARLKATHEDAARLRASRKDLAPTPGLNDYRAILHSHAEDSAHTGGTRPEILAEAKKAGIHAILLTDHHRPPRDFINDSWRGLREGVLFLPGSEARGFLLYPTRSVMTRMDEPTPAFVATVREGGGLIFLSHIEERPDHPMDGLDGLEIYNRHADAKKDRAGLLALTLRLTDPSAFSELAESLERYPDELFAFHCGYQADYMAKWDRETASRRLTGVAANDCHHNQVMLVKMVDEENVLVGTNVDRDDQMFKVSAKLRPGVRTMTKGRKPGDVLVRLDLDPYHRSFQNVSTHVLAPKLDEPSIREALRAGHAYVSHDWVCDPTGFRFEWLAPGARPALMGDEAPFKAGGKLVATVPAPCRLRLKSGGKTVAEGSGERLEFTPTAPGVYRLEAWVVLDGEERPWLYSNPIYLR